jgi:hypothetical protein
VGPEPSAALPEQRWPNLPEHLARSPHGVGFYQRTYGRFLATVDAMHLMWVMQAHHLDTDYYDRFFRRGAYGSTHAAHIATWHR